MHLMRHIYRVAAVLEDAAGLTDASPYGNWRLSMNDLVAGKTGDWVIIGLEVHAQVTSTQTVF